MVSHSIDMIRELSDKAIWIENGIIHNKGNVSKICDNYENFIKNKREKLLQN